MDQLNRETVPAGLVGVADLIARVPERAMEVIGRERQNRELSLISIHQMNKTYSWNPGRTVWIALLIGLTAFSLLWSMSTTLGMFRSTGTSVGGVMKELSSLGIELPSNIAKPVSSASTLADTLPNFGIGDSIAMSFGSMILYGIFKFFMVMPNLDRLKTLREEEKRIEEEMRYLSMWMTQSIGQTMESKDANAASS